MIVSTVFCAINNEHETVSSHVENARCVDKTKFLIAARKWFEADYESFEQIFHNCDQWSIETLKKKKKWKFHEQKENRIFVYVIHKKINSIIHSNYDIWAYKIFFTKKFKKQCKSKNIISNNHWIRDFFLFQFIIIKTFKLIKKIVTINWIC